MDGTTPFLCTDRIAILPGSISPLQRCKTCQVTCSRNKTTKTGRTSSFSMYYYYYYYSTKQQIIL